MELKLRIIVQDDCGKRFLGRGVLILLESIESEKSLRQAATKLGISYTKAHRMISFLEESLGGNVVSHSKGGKERRGSELTAFGKAVLRRFKDFEEDCILDSNKKFVEFEKDINKIQEDYLYD